MGQSVMEQVSGWQPIETAPKDGTTILGFWCNGEMHTGSICNGEWIPAWEHQNNNWDIPTHWMPLPPPPNEI
jgi:hypothetical protein